MAKVFVRMPDELHRGLKMEAVRRNLAMQELVQSAVEQLLASADRVDRSTPGISAPSHGSADAFQEFADLRPDEHVMLSAVLKLMRQKPSASRDRLIRILRVVLDSGDADAPERAKRKRS